MFGIKFVTFKCDDAIERESITRLLASKAFNDWEDRVKKAFSEGTYFFAVRMHVAALVSCVSDTRSI